MHLYLYLFLFLFVFVNHDDLTAQCRVPDKKVGEVSSLPRNPGTGSKSWKLAPISSKSSSRSAAADFVFDAKPRFLAFYILRPKDLGEAPPSLHGGEGATFPLKELKRFPKCASTYIKHSVNVTYIPLVHMCLLVVQCLPDCTIAFESLYFLYSKKVSCVNHRAGKGAKWPLGREGSDHSGTTLQWCFARLQG